MADHESITLGEVSRSVHRIEEAVEALAGQCALHPCSILNERVNQINVHLVATDSALVTLDERVTAVQVKAGYLSGIIAVAGAAVNYLFGRH